MIEQTISHYRITEKLGAGGMGIVYKARDMTLERTVALKFLPDGVAVSDEDKKDLLREARATSMYPILAPSALPMNSVEMEFQLLKSTIETSTTARGSANISRVRLKEGRSS
jgi:serine/threonine protein kinase